MFFLLNDFIADAFSSRLSFYPLLLHFGLLSFNFIPCLTLLAETDFKCKGAEVDSRFGSYSKTDPCFLGYLVTEVVICTTGLAPVGRCSGT
jgi:hypothetical protein